MILLGVLDGAGYVEDYVFRFVLLSIACRIGDFFTLPNLNYSPAIRIGWEHMCHMKTRIISSLLFLYFLVLY